MAKRELINITLGVLCLPTIASAQIVITEIMYDLSVGSDSGREWIEVHNIGSEPVNLTEWRLFENDTNHGLKAMGGETLQPGAYAVIADNPTKFAADWPTYGGPVFDSAFSLANGGETLVMRCCGKDLSDRDSVAFNNTGGGAGDGLTLHRNGSTLSAAQPSPGNGDITAPPPPAPEEEPDPAPEAKSVIPTVVQQKEQPAPEKMVKEPEVVSSTVQEQNEIEESSMRETVPIVVTSIIQEEREVPQKKQNMREEKNENVAEDVISEDIAESEVSEAVSQLAVAEASIPRGTSSSWVWWAGAGAVSFLGAMGAYAAGRARREDWKIEESE